LSAFLRRTLANLVRSALMPVGLPRFMDAVIAAPMPFVASMRGGGKIEGSSQMRHNHKLRDLAALKGV
jgi:hypothetical protein